MLQSCPGNLNEGKSILSIKTKSQTGNVKDPKSELFDNGKVRESPKLVPFESGKITAVLGHIGRVAHCPMPHAAGLRCTPPTNLQ